MWPSKFFETPEKIVKGTNEKKFKDTFCGTEKLQGNLEKTNANTNPFKIIEKFPKNFQTFWLK